jgi:cytochrome P450
MVTLPERENLRGPFPFLRKARLEENVFYSPEIDSWVVTKYDDALGSPGDNYLRDVVRRHHEDPTQLTVNYLYNTAFQFQFAGHETTTQAAANGISRLLESRDQGEEICAEPSLIPNAAEECRR